MIAVNRKYNKELSFELINKVSSKKIHNTDLPNSNILQLAVPFRKVRDILRKRNSRFYVIEIASVQVCVQRCR